MQVFGRMPVALTAGSSSVQLCKLYSTLPLRSAVHDKTNTHERWLPRHKSLRPSRLAGPVAAKNNDAGPFFTERSKGCVPSCVMSQLSLPSTWQQWTSSHEACMPALAGLEGAAQKMTISGRLTHAACSSLQEGSLRQTKNQAPLW